MLVNNAAGGTAWQVVRHDRPPARGIDPPHDSPSVLVVREALPHLSGRAGDPEHRRRRNGRVGFAAYIAAKGGLNALTRSIAVDYAAAGIRCNTISPGYVLNARRDADIDASRRSRYEGMHLTRLGEAADVALAAVYLASRESEFVTGINLQLDGGSSIARGLTLG